MNHSFQIKEKIIAVAAGREPGSAAVISEDTTEIRESWAWLR